MHPKQQLRPAAARGQSMVELALMLPIVLMLILGAVDVAQVMSAQQHLENATYLAALRLLKRPGLHSPSVLAAYIQAESGLSPVTAGTSYSIDGGGANQVVVTATYNYPLLLPGLRNLQTGITGNGYYTVSVSSASVATTDPPTLSDTSGAVQVAPPVGTTVPSGLTLTCALFRDTTPVPTPQPCTAGSATWAYTPTPGVTHTYSATVMQVDGITSPPSTPVTGP